MKIDLMEEYLEAVEFKGECNFCCFKNKIETGKQCATCMCHTGKRDNFKLPKKVKKTINILQCRIDEMLAEEI